MPKISIKLEFLFRGLTLVVCLATTTTSCLQAQSIQSIVDSLKLVLPDVKDPIQKVDLLNEIAYTNRRISGEETLKFAKLAYAEALKVNYIKGQSIAQKNMGIAHYKMISPKDSMVYHYERAIELAEKIDDYYTQAACNNNIALLYGYQVDPFKAMKHYLRGIEIFDKHIKEEKSLKALMLANVAQFQITIENYEKALIYIERAFKVAERNNYQIILTNYSDEYGKILTHLGDYQEAEKVLLNGLAIGKSLGDEYGIIGNLNRLAELELYQGNCDKANEYVKQVPTRKNNKRFNRYYLKNLLNKAKVSFCKKDLSGTVKYAEEVIEKGKKYRLNDAQQEARKLLSEVLSLRGKHKAAFNYLSEYNSVNDVIIKTQKIASAADLEAKYQFSEKEKEISYLESAKEIKESHINRLRVLIFLILLTLGIIGFLLIKGRNAAAQIREKNAALSKYIASNLQLENFAYIASHDLRTPLLTIKNFVDLVRDKAKSRLNDEELQSLDFARGGAEDMIHLVDDLMNFSTLQKSELQKEKINLPDFVNYVLDLNQPLIAANDAQVNLEFSSYFIEADRSKLLQLIQNLIQNAIKFHKKGLPPILTIQGFSNMNDYIFSVKDNGIGIAPSYFEKIFLLFKRLHNKSNYRGTGIGLAMCKKIIEMHGGKIWVESAIGEGATFYCSFPIKQ